MSEVVNRLKVEDPLKETEKGLEDFKRILEKFLNLSERDVISFHYQCQDETNLQRKHSNKSAPQSNETSRLARGQLEIVNGGTLEQTCPDKLSTERKKEFSDAPSAPCADAQRHQQKKGFFQRLLRSFRQPRTSRRTKNKNSKQWAQKKGAQEKTGQNEEHDEKSRITETIYTRTPFPPSTKDNFHSLQEKSYGFDSPAGADGKSGNDGPFSKMEDSHSSSAVGDRSHSRDNFITSDTQDIVVNVESHGQQMGQVLAFRSNLTNSYFPTKSILDEPSEDIKFIDDDDDDDSMRGLVKGGGKSADQDSAPANDPPRISIMSGLATKPVTTVVRCVHDGVASQIDSTDLSIPASKPVLKACGTSLPWNPSKPHVARQQRQFSLEEDGGYNDDFPDGKDPPAEAEGKPPCTPTDSKKDELATEIAETIMAIGDQYATDRNELAELERELVECLRTLGDDCSAATIGPGEKIIQAVTEPTYQRFKEIIKNSLGNEISWNHLFILFHTVKGVVSLVGRSSRFFSRTVTFASRYYLDELHGWVTQRGGFQHLLDQRESAVD